MIEINVLHKGIVRHVGHLPEFIPNYIFILKSVRVASKSACRLLHIPSFLSHSASPSILVYQRMSVKFNVGNFHENL